MIGKRSPDTRHNGAPGDSSTSRPVERLIMLEMYKSSIVLACIRPLVIYGTIRFTFLPGRVTGMQRSRDSDTLFGPSGRNAKACENCRTRRIKCEPPYPCRACRGAGLTDCKVRAKPRWILAIPVL